MSLAMLYNLILYMEHSSSLVGEQKTVLPEPRARVFEW